MGENVFDGHIEYARGLVRRCVLYVLPAEQHGDELERRQFRNEAAIGLEVSGDHQNLISTLDYGELSDGSLYLAVDHIEGRALAALMSAGLLRGRFDDIRMLGRELLHALRFLHRSGVAHGDVVAGNVLVDTHGRARLANFSRAMRFESSSDDGDGDAPARGVLEDLRALGRLLFELAADMPASYRGNPMAREHLTLQLPNDLSLLIVFLLDHTEEFAEQQASIPIDGGCLPLTCSAPDTRAGLPAEPRRNVGQHFSCTFVLVAFVLTACVGSSIPTGTQISPEFFKYATVVEAPSDGSTGGWRAVCIKASTGQRIANANGAHVETGGRCGLEFGTPIVNRQHGYIPLRMAQLARINHQPLVRA